MKARTLHPGVLEDIKKIIFRQSFLKDYLTCPQMALYRWVIEVEESAPWMAGLLGTAGHHVIFTMHTERRWDYSHHEISEIFQDAFYVELRKCEVPPNVGQDYNSIDEQLAAVSPQYVEWLYNYQRLETNQQFYSTIHEQSFVLELRDQADPDAPPYYFTGQIDQAGLYENGDFVLRDIKFRDNNFRPSKVELQLDVQMSIYATALWHGKPACAECRPRYVTDPFGVQAKQLVYEGPCDKCSKLMGTPAWPMRPPVRCEMIWMRDFELHTKDQYDKEVIDKTLPKVRNPETNRLVYARVPNPDWAKGYKAGDMKGEGIIKTYRNLRDLDVLMSDVLTICKFIRNGAFYRKPGDQCNFWCKYKESCLKGIELEATSTRIEEAKGYGTEDPF
jgi:hypothetical protein